MKKPRAAPLKPPDPDMVALNENMSRLAHKLAGPGASFADFEMILLALRTEVMVQVRAAFAREAAFDVEGMKAPRAAPKAPRRRR
ncbi:MAG: hypothetical protein Q8S73_44910 [Deltaproteobacteria bacterium]|nr:hypothetical protein [Myxococcales bacterium]MDP3221308.1 hypothetical protein [Deltaproteobacteria bacterium]